MMQQSTARRRYSSLLLRLLLGMAIGMLVSLQFFYYSTAVNFQHDDPSLLPHRPAPKSSPSRVVPPNERRLLRDKLQDLPSLDTTTTTYLWEHSDYLPPWAKNYLHWHAQSRQNTSHFSLHNLPNLRLWIVQCTGADPCGGAGDRLKAMPYLVRKAAQTERLLLIHWSKPCRITEFLQPPVGGLDWRVPNWMLEALETYDSPTRPHKSVEHIELYTNATALAQAKARHRPKPPDALHPGIFFRTKLQIYDAGAGMYNSYLISKKEATFDQVYHDWWQVLFTPSPAVAEKITTYLRNQHLQPGHYVSAHIRAVYDHEEIPKLTTKWTQNALNCASHLRAGNAPIFVAADSQAAIQVAIDYGARQNATVLTHPSHPDPPLHLDRYAAMTIHDKTDEDHPPPQDFFDTFVDLYIMSLGRSVFTTRGGYGHWALLMGGNVTQQWRMQWKARGGLKNPCVWLAAAGDAAAVVEEERDDRPIFFPGMGF